MRIVDPFRTSFFVHFFRKTAAAAMIYAAVAHLSAPARAADEAAEQPDAQRPPLVIRPANYDPADELAYTRRHGQLEPGHVADGKIWNKPPGNLSPGAFSPGDLRAADSGVLTPPAPAESGNPVSAASGIPVPRMTYVQAYAQIPFYRSEYEANPSYRHDAAMELMFGVMRPATIVRHTMPYFSRYPDLFRYRYSVYPYPYSGGGTSNVNMYWNTSLIAY